ncbi:MAG: DUF5615 family PIN-like protein [Verrucomicrobia bacterium]|nr:DUF5615 family PIN-like protein [Verrucomicrobiota bacterium]
MRRFLIDNQLPAALTRWIEAQDCVAEHVLALDLGKSPDTAIWLHAAATGSVIISKDEDFAKMTLVRPELVSVVWLRLGNCRTSTLIENMVRVWPQIIRQLESGAQLIEVC